MPEFYWIPTDTQGRLAIVQRPRGGDWLEDEIRRWKRTGVSEVISMLEEEEQQDLDLLDEGTECERNGIVYRSLPIPDRGVPERRSEFENVVNQVTASLIDGQSVVVHCRQGIGRSSLLAACVLKSLGLTSEEVIQRVTESRGMKVPETQEQTDWIRRYEPTTLLSGIA